MDTTVKKFLTNHYKSDYKEGFEDGMEHIIRIVARLGLEVEHEESLIITKVLREIDINKIKILSEVQ